MATFYRGAGIGTFWHGNDALIDGFTAHSPGTEKSNATIISHIKNGTTYSPFISITRSYSIALNYALYAGLAAPTKKTPAYVYEIEIKEPLPSGLEVIDPTYSILSEIAVDPLKGLPYQHDGHQDFLIGVIQPRTMAKCLHKEISHPPPGGAVPRNANLSPELETIVRVLRDSELLVSGTIPSKCVIKKYDVIN